MIRGFTPEEQARGRETQRRNRELRGRRSLTHEPSLEDLRRQLLVDAVALQGKIRAAIAGLPADRATDHGALARALIALSERIDAMIAAERHGPSESYEARLARAYTSQGMTPPGRGGMDDATPRSESRQPQPSPFPASPHAAGREALVTPSFDEGPSENEDM